MKSKMQRRRVVRQQEAVERELQRKSRTPKEQLSLLDKRLGKNQGAKKERDRLNSLIEKKDKVKEIVKEKPKFKVKKGENPIKAKKKFNKENK